MQITERQNESSWMIEKTSNSKMLEKAQSIIEHLKVESAFLDSVIDSSREMQALLRHRQPVQGASANRDPQETESVDDRATAPIDQTERNQQLTARLTEIREQIARQFLPVIEGRRKMVETIHAINVKQEPTPSITSLALKVDEPIRGNLRALRDEIRFKLNQVQAISMGSQAILLYTMDFYQRMLTGLSKDKTRSSYYNATGRSQNTTAINLIETNG